MASASAKSMPELSIEMEKRYVTKQYLDIYPLHSSSKQQQYVVRLGDDKSYVISEKFKEILQLLDGTRTLREVAAAFSAKEKMQVSDAQMSQIVSLLINRHELIEELGANSDKASGVKDQPPQASKKRKYSLEIVYRLPLISPRLVAPITDRLIWLFAPSVVFIAIISIILAQLALFEGWFAPFPKFSFGASDILIYYSLAVFTALFHEFGHAAACRKYGCDHGSIGFLLYMIFPSLYINLSNVWRLPSKQRAVVDAGGMYFQLLTTIPLCLIYWLTGNLHCAATVLSVDIMVLLSLNPILRFDGYWLLVDLSGLVNLRARSWRVIKEVVLWCLGKTTSVPALDEITGRGKKLLLVTYSFIAVGMFSSFIFFLIAFLPARIGMLINSAYEIFTGRGEGMLATLKHLPSLLMTLFFMLFVYRFLRSIALNVFKIASRKRP